MSARRAASSAWRGLQAAMKGGSTSSFGPSVARPAMAAASSSIPRSGISVASLLFAGVPKLSVPPSPPPPTFASSAISTSAIAPSPGGSAPGSGGSSGGLPASDEEGGDADPPHLKRIPRNKKNRVNSKTSEDDIFGSAASIKKMRETAEAKAVMEDPMSMLLASRGMPLGISSAALGERSKTLTKGGAAGGDDESDDDDDDKKSVEKKEFEMEALKEIFDQTSAPATPGEEKADSWGTTKKGAEEIARQLVESNRELDKLSAELGESESSPLPSVDDLDPDLTLAPGEQKYKTLEQMSKDIKDLDECFELLASVPWLDEDTLQQKELKGVAMTGLLGTLEEVGFGIRAHVHRIWGGERDHGLITECTEAKDQAALISILFHTKKLEEEYGTPPPVKI